MLSLQVSYLKKRCQAKCYVLPGAAGTGSV